MRNSDLIFVWKTEELLIYLKDYIYNILIDYKELISFFWRQI